MKVEIDGKEFWVPGCIEPQPIELDENGMPVCRDMNCQLREDCQVVNPRRVKKLAVATVELVMEGGVRVLKE